AKVSSERKNKAATRNIQQLAKQVINKLKEIIPPTTFHLGNGM
ncbi:2654_t:CDS:1, partial [Ambispora leptoticha]